MHILRGDYENQDYQLAQPQQGQQQNQNPLAPLGQSALGLSGLLLASGVPLSKAYAQGSQLYAQQQTSNAHAQEVQQKQQNQQLKQRALQALQANRDNPEAVNQILYSGVFDGREIKALKEGLGGGAEKLVSGAGGVKYTQGRNPETGEVELTPVAGQIQKPILTPTELRINRAKLTEVANEARAAVRENRYLKDAEKAFAKYDKAHPDSSFRGTGSLLTRLPFGLDSNALLSKEGQIAKQEVDKVSGLIFQNRVQGLGRNATDVAKEQIKKSLPTTEILPEARRELLSTKLRENAETIARSKFLSEWDKQNGGDLSGAEDLFLSYIGTVDLLDKEGKINERLLKDIPKVVKEFSDQDVNPRRNKESSNDVMQEQPVFEEDIIEGARRELARRRQQSAGY